MNIKPGVLPINTHSRWDWFWNNVTFSVPFIAGDGREIITGTHPTLDDRPSIIRAEGMQRDFTTQGRIRFLGLPKFAYDWTLKNGLFTILIDLEPTQTPSGGGDGVLSARQGTDSLGEWQVYADDAGGGAWSMRFPTVGQLFWAGSMSINAVNRAALIRVPGGVWQLYVNGVDYGTQTESAEITTTIPQEDIAIGSRVTTSNSSGFIGYISAVHILNGYAATEAESRQFSEDPFGPFRQFPRGFEWVERRPTIRVRARGRG